MSEKEKSNPLKFYVYCEYAPAQDFADFDTYKKAQLWAAKKRAEGYDTDIIFGQLLENNAEIFETTKKKPADKKAKKKPKKRLEKLKLKKQRKSTITKKEAREIEYGNPCRPYKPSSLARQWPRTPSRVLTHDQLEWEK